MNVIGTWRKSSGFTKKSPETKQVWVVSKFKHAGRHFLFVYSVFLCSIINC